MEKRIVVTKRFQKNTFFLYEYLMKEYSAKTAYRFLDRLQQQIELIGSQPEIGKPLQQKAHIRSLTLPPHNRIYYRLKKETIELLCLFDMRRKKPPY